MALIATVDIPVDGFSVPTPLPNAAAGGGDEAESGDFTFLAVRNASAGVVNVTINAPAVAGGVVQYVVAVPATSGLVFIPIGRRNMHPHELEGGVLRRNTNVNDRAHWTYSAVTSVTVAVYRLPS